MIVGPPSLAGAACENNPNFTQLSVMNWTAGTVTTIPIAGPEFGYLSPSGIQVALVDNNGTTFMVSRNSMAGLFACTWIDDAHVLSGGDAQHQPRVGTPATGVVVPVAAQGDCGGRIPGGL